MSKIMVLIQKSVKRFMMKAIKTDGILALIEIDGSVAKMAENELKSCPFCGEKDRISVAAYLCASEFWHYVFCDECLAEGPVGKTEQDAVDAWNWRANDGRE